MESDCLSCLCGDDRYQSDRQRFHPIVVAGGLVPGAAVSETIANSPTASSSYPITRPLALASSDPNG